MQKWIASETARARIAQWAHLVSVALIIAPLAVMTVVLAHALGGGMLAYGVAGALVLSLAVLVLFVLTTRPQAPEPRAEMNGHIIQAQRDKIAA